MGLDNFEFSVLCRIIRRDGNSSIGAPLRVLTPCSPCRTETENYRLPFIYRLPCIVLEGWVFHGVYKEKYHIGRAVFIEWSNPLHPF
jgi:hypothetical protein